MGWLKTRSIVVAHLLLYALAYFLPYCLRFEFSIPISYRGLLLGTLPVVIGVKLSTFYFSGEFRASLSYAGIADLKRILLAASVASLVMVTGEKFAALDPIVPRSIQLMDWMLTFVLISGMRVVLRVVRERSWRELLRNGSRRVLIVGAGDAGESLVRELQRRPEVDVRAIGFLDDDPAKLGRTIGGLRIVGTVADAARLSAEMDVGEAIIAMPSATKEQTRIAVHKLREAGLAFRALPHMVRTASCVVDPSQISDVTIGELLGRDPVAIDLGSVGRLLHGRKVVVTGAAGSIGSEICRQVLRFGPAHVVAVDHCESGIFFLQRELQAESRGTALGCLVGDIRDRAHMAEVLAECRADVIFHAAAHKHVPLMEMNPCEAVINNVAGTRVLAELAIERGVGCFVAISTDKAVNPTSVMGMTKRVVEMLVHSLAVERAASLLAVRFGNVLDSSGSVVPLFREQIKAGGPVTVTHPGMTRFFMTIHEAVQLVLQASAIGKPGQILVLDMGEPVKILNLARELIGLAGLREPDDIRIEFVGVRPGEKLHEAISSPDETLRASDHAGVMIALGPTPDHDVFGQQLAELEWSARSGNGDLVRSLLQKMTRSPTPETAVGRDTAAGKQAAGED